jgi:hypothetical protein
MALWGNLDASNNAPVFADTGGLGLTANTQGALFNNTTIATTSTDVGVAGMAVGVFGVDATEMANTESVANTAGGHAGWVLRKEGTGGRAGRVHVETLVAMGSMTGDSDDDTTFDDSAIITIVTQPQSEVIDSGDGINLSVVASVVPVGTALSYQWYDVSNNVILSSNTSSTLVIDDLTANASFNVVVSASGADSRTSAVAVIEVQ